MKPDARHDRFKALENESERIMPSQRIYIMRLDGRGFSRYTKGLTRPFDTDFMAAMNAITVELCREIGGSVLGYVQSDEVSIVFTDRPDERTQLWFGGRLNKWLSVSASIAAGTMSRAFPDKPVAMFDARVVEVESADDVADYLEWRAQDARKNAISMAAGTLFSHRQLTNVGTGERARMLEGTEFAVDKLPTGFLCGRLVTKVDYTEMVTVPAYRDRPETQVEAVRSKWVVSDADAEQRAAVVSGLAAKTES